MLPTWTHCMVGCPAPAFKVRRQGVLEAMEKVVLGDVSNGSARGGTHTQLNDVFLLLNDRSRVDFNFEDERSKEAEKEMCR